MGEVSDDDKIAMIREESNRLRQLAKEVLALSLRVDDALRLAACGLDHRIDQIKEERPPWRTRH